MTNDTHTSTIHAATLISSRVQAVQWQNTPDSLRAMQQLLWPASPLFQGDFTHAIQTSLGVHVASSRRSYGVDYDLAHAEVGDWIVKDAQGRVSIVKAMLFASLYLLGDAGDVMGTGETDRLQLVEAGAGDAVIAGVAADETGRVDF